MADCTVTRQTLEDLERLAKQLAVEGGWTVQAQLIRFIEEHPTLLTVLTGRARSILTLAEDCAARGVRGVPVAGSDVLRMMVERRLISEAQAVSIVKRATEAFTADPNTPLGGR